MGHYRSWVNVTSNAAKSTDVVLTMTYRVVGQLILGQGGYFYARGQNGAGRQ
jgi:hypothetical protein